MTMKTLMDNGINTGILFKEGTTNEDICNWVNENLGFTSLNEAHSCTASLDSQEDVIVISGDEDRKEIDILPVSFVN